MVTRWQSHPTDETRICPGDRLTGAGSALGIRCPASSHSRARRPIRTHVRRPTRPPLLYFAAVLAVRSVRISLLTSGAKRARTADLLHAIWRQHVHPRPSPQVTVLPRPRTSARVRVSCCTCVLYSAPLPSLPTRALPIRRRASSSWLLSYCCATVAIWLSARSAPSPCPPTWTRKSLPPPSTPG